MALLRLPLTDATLEFDPAERHPGVWLDDGNRRLLGRHDSASIRSRLLTGLAGPGAVSHGELDGLPAYCVLLLAGPHCAFYAQFGPDGRRLLIQEGPLCVWGWRGGLSDRDWRVWQELLAKGLLHPGEPGT